MRDGAKEFMFRIRLLLNGCSSIGKEFLSVNFRRFGIFQIQINTGFNEKVAGRW